MDVSGRRAGIWLHTCVVLCLAIGLSFCWAKFGYHAKLVLGLPRRVSKRISLINSNLVSEIKQSLLF